MENIEELLLCLHSLLDYNDEDEETNDAIEYGIECINKIEAIKARINGEFDNEKLISLGATLSTNPLEDIGRILKA